MSTPPEPSLLLFHPSAGRDGSVREFNYDEAFSRNIGWVSEWEQQALRSKTIAVAGLGGVGGVHLLTLARLGIGAFHIADMDRFELANLNRQAGATLSTLGEPKSETMARLARDINPQIELKAFPEGISEDNIDAFLDGVDLFVDGFDFFALDIRAKVFARCAERSIPAITAAPIGMGTAYLIFMPGGMTFEAYFRLAGLPDERRYVNFLVGLNPRGLHRPYLVDPSRVDFAAQRAPSTSMACQLCAGVVGVEALKILLGRGPVRAAPHYHHFDAYRGKWVSGWLPGGNRNPLQVLRRQIGYRVFARMSEQARPAEVGAVETEIEAILELARWAPSGDNAQPWRFRITGEDSVRVHARMPSESNVYEYNCGQPTLLSVGMLLETIRVSASRFGRILLWEYQRFQDGEHVIDLDLPKTPAITPDPLVPYVTTRSVDRRRYRTSPLTEAQKQELAACLGDELAITWYETSAERWRMARLNALATDIRLRTPEAFRVHRRILDWSRRFSPDGVPVGAVGLDALTLRIMRWAMGDWARMRRLNRMPGGTSLTRLQMDYAPGLCCAAHFLVMRKTDPEQAGEVASLLRAGEALQRFWLTGTRMRLVMQPSLAPLCFAHYGRLRTPFTEDGEIRRMARTLAERMDGILRGRSGSPLFFGRLGYPISGKTRARSVRRSLRELVLEQEGEDGSKSGREP